MKKGQTWVARQVRKLPKGGVATPSTLPLDPPMSTMKHENDVSDMTGCLQFVKI